MVVRSRDPQPSSHARQRDLARRGWDWMVQCYYKDDVLPPKVPGGLAIETIHKGDHSKDMEVAAAKTIADYGRIEVIRLRES